MRGAPVTSKDLSDAALLAKLRERYAPTVIPPCRVCGGELSLESFGGGMPTIWRCSPWQPTEDEPLRRKPGRGIADKHYSDSEFIDRRQGGDADVIELIERFESHGY